MNPLIPLAIVKEYHYCSSTRVFNGIKYPMKIDMPLNKVTKLKVHIMISYICLLTFVTNLSTATQMEEVCGPQGDYIKNVTSSQETGV